MPGDKSFHRLFVSERSSSQLHRCRLFDTQSTRFQAESASDPAVYVSSAVQAAADSLHCRPIYVFLTVDASACIHFQSLMPATSHSIEYHTGQLNSALITCIAVTRDKSEVWAVATGNMVWE